MFHNVFWAALFIKQTRAVLLARPTTKTKPKPDPHPFDASVLYFP